MRIKDSGDRTQFDTGAVHWESIEFLIGKNCKYIKESDGYFVLDDGNVFSVKSGKVLKPIEDRYGYHFVNIYEKTGNMKSRKIHRLVAEAFIPNPKNLPQVNHINEDKHDNRVCNLEWCDAVYNNSYGKRDSQRNVYEYDLDGNYLKEYHGIRNAAATIGCHENTLRSVCNGKGSTVKGKMYRWYKADSIPPLTERERRYAKRYNDKGGLND